MENTELFPNMVNQMIAVGEESGSLDEMSGKVADFYEEEVDNAVDSTCRYSRWAPSSDENLPQQFWKSLKPGLLL